jgi:hypothetical protein
VDPASFSLIDPIIFDTEGRVTDNVGNAEIPDAQLTPNGAAGTWVFTDNLDPSTRPFCVDISADESAAPIDFDLDLIDPGGASRHIDGTLAPDTFPGTGGVDNGQLFSTPAGYTYGPPSMTYATCVPQTTGTAPPTYPSGGGSTPLAGAAPAAPAPKKKKKKKKKKKRKP